MSSNQAKNVPFAGGSVSLGLHDSAPSPGTRMRNLCDQGRAAVGCFDGVTISEHHGGLDGYIPVPVHLAGWILAANSDLWAAPCPVLLPLRDTGLFLEEIGWLAAAFPGRVGYGVAPGWRGEDFEIVGRSVHTRAAAFAAQLGEISRALAGQLTPPLSSDPAVSRLATSAPLGLCAVGSKAAARRAGPTGLGIYISGYTDGPTAQALGDEYRATGGTGPRVLIRRVWVGRDAPMHAIEQMYTEATRHPWAKGGLGTYITGDPDEVVARIRTAVRECHATAVNVRFWMPGLPVSEALRQIELFGSAVFPALAEALSPTARAVSP
jgi:alkanesulfonate monooxygenase SsuD/methylene tetrahydromethanopterin reductase-like flavin-dependent oxidoreductase (luciferase family)